MRRTVGVILCVIGVIGLVWGGITYTTEEQVVDVGPVEITSERSASCAWSGGAHCWPRAYGHKQEGRLTPRVPQS